jgi:hypothetical protein
MTVEEYLKQQLGNMAFSLAIIQAERDNYKDQNIKLKEELLKKSEEIKS